MKSVFTGIVESPKNYKYRRRKSISTGFLIFCVALFLLIVLIERKIPSSLLIPLLIFVSTTFRSGNNLSFYENEIHVERGSDFTRIKMPAIAQMDGVEYDYIFETKGKVTFKTKANEDGYEIRLKAPWQNYVCKVSGEPVTNTKKVGLMRIGLKATDIQAFERALTDKHPLP